jgi:NAD-dependent SIR2 family protein deacetylase
VIFYSNTSLAKKTIILKTALEKTEALVIGAGAGLSAAAGLDYDNVDTFNTLFPGYHDRYDLQTINEADFYPFPTLEEQYAYWLKSISAIRYNFPRENPALIHPV